MTESLGSCSVVAVGYRHAAYARTCLDSIAAQVRLPDELLLVDDASDDTTPDVAAAWAGRHAALQPVLDLHPQNLGITATCDRALRRLTGDYVAIVAMDDVLEPDHLRRLCAALDAAPEAAVAYGDAVVVDQDGVVVAPSFLAAHGADPAGPPTGSALYAELLRGSWIPAMATVVRRRMLLDAGGYDTRLSYEDWDVWLRLARRHPFVYAGAPPVAQYRVLATSLMHADPDRHRSSSALILSKHLDRGTARRVLALGCAERTTPTGRAALRALAMRGRPPRLALRAAHTLLTSRLSR